ncbi:MAG: glycosyltransferase family protein [Planctomycetota bacterium]
MARIVYTLSGEGLGHTTRAQAVIEHLVQRHHVCVYAPPISWQMLGDQFADHPRVTIRKLKCLNFRYFRKRLSYTATLASAAPFLLSLSTRVRRLAREMRTWGATHVLNDFEPIGARAAKQLDLPLIALNHQDFLTTIDAKPLPAPLGRRVRFLRLSTRLFCPNADRRIVSSYYAYPIIASLRLKVDRVGVLIRDVVASAKPVCGDHVLVYQRRHLPTSMYESLRRCGRTVLVYGLGSAPIDGNLRFLPRSDRRFVDHLRTAAALVCSSGNQLIGEALHLRKAILAVPESGNFEQQLNGYFLPTTGGGITVQPKDVRNTTIAQFLENVPRLMQSISDSEPGNVTASQILDRVLGDTVVDLAKEARSDVLPASSVAELHSPSQSKASKWEETA